MSRSRVHRLVTAFLVVMSLLVSQLAMAGYVCPRQADADTMASMAAMVATGQPCEGMDRQQPTLCHAHAADPGKAFEALKLPDVSQPAVVQVLALPLLLDAREAHAVPAAATLVVRPPPDPLFLATLRLRV